jgi:hypothetical protein
MHKRIYSLLFLACSLLFGLASKAQSGGPAPENGRAAKPEMADALRADGKIYVVVTVLVILLLGLVLYVARLDRKISRLEKSKE